MGSSFRDLIPHFSPCTVEGFPVAVPLHIQSRLLSGVYENQKTQEWALLPAQVSQVTRVSKNSAAVFVGDLCFTVFSSKINHL